MKALITGGTGFVGGHLCQKLLREGHHVISASRSADRQKISHEKFTALAADLTQPGSWQDDIRDVDAVVNLAGKSIFTYWTDKAKKRIYDSRVKTTRNLVDALGKNVTLCSASAVGYYGDRGDDVLLEDEPPGDDFLARVGIDWEDAALEARNKGCRVVLMRFGIVLGEGGGAMEKMIPAFKAFLGGPLGDGKQWFPWIHLQDLLSAIGFCLENRELDGPANFCAPESVTNKEFAKTLARALNRPAIMPAPKPLIRLALGEFGETLLNSHKALPDKLLKSGFHFQYPKLRGAIDDIVN